MMHLWARHHLGTSMPSFENSPKSSMPRFAFPPPSPFVGMTSTILLLVALSASDACASLREALAPYVDLASTDTLRSLSPASTSKILLSRGTKDGPRTEEFTVSSLARKELLDLARAESLLVDSASAVANVPLDESQNQHRKQFTGGLSGLGALAFGSAVVIGLQPENAGIILATATVSYPASFWLHHLYARDRLWTQSHLDGAVYGATSAYWGSLATIFALGGFDSEQTWRTASFVGLAAYPVGVHLGYAYGQRQLSDPGRIGLASSLAWQGAFTGAMLPIALADWDDGAEWSPIYRSSAAGFVGGGLLGHAMGSFLHTGETVPTGAGIGTSVLATLGAWSGLGLGLLAEDPSTNSIATLVVAGNTLGALGGYTIATRRRDTRERAQKIGAGMALGGLVGSLASMIALGFEEDPSIIPSVALPLAGAWLGYGVATLATESSGNARESTTHLSTKQSWIGDVNVSPIAFPSKTSTGTRWTWPGVVVSLR